MSDFEIEKLGESSGRCDCCGHSSHTIWGWIHSGPATVAAYWTNWADGHLSDVGATFDLVVGSWGEGTSIESRSAISLLYKAGPDGGFMLIDAAPYKSLAARQLQREEVVGTPLADQAFSLVDTIWEQDDRLFAG